MEGRRSGEVSKEEKEMEGDREYEEEREREGKGDYENRKRGVEEIETVKMNTV